MDKWNQTHELAGKHESGGSTWLRLAGDGDRAVVAFRSDPHPREVVFVDGGYKPFTEELAAQGLKPSLRVAINVVVFPGKEAKVFEFGVGLFKDLVKVREKYGLDTWAFEISRSGGPKDPKTTYSILPERQLSAEEQKALAALQLHDLEAMYDGQGGGSVGKGAGGFDESIDDKAAQELMAALKELPREAVDRFCQRFGVERIRELPASVAEKARTYLSTLRAEYAPPSSAAQRDPFA